MGELYPRHERRTKNPAETTGNRYKIEFLMSRTQKLKGLSAASLRLKTLNDNRYINEKPDSAIVVLKSYRGLASQDEGTEALYAMLITRAEYIATDSIASDSLIQGAVKYYNKESDNSEMILE